MEVGTGFLERVFILAEYVGFPKPVTEWLRHRRIVVIILLAILSWCIFALLAFALFFVGTEIFDVLNDAVHQS
ncbi:MAG TPA: hypothetical protein VGN60_08610 [Devosia sp.]|nr:hypothetical protein [Devosia sp.]